MTKKIAPVCFGKHGEHDPGLCFECCDPETQSACWRAAYLRAVRAGGKNQIPPHNRPLLRLGYPAGVLVE